MTEWFELFYSDGGHGGPILGLDSAQREAVRYLQGFREPEFRTVYIVRRDCPTIWAGNPRGEAVSVVKMHKGWTISVE